MTDRRAPISIDHLTEPELRELHGRIVDRLRLFIEVRQRLAIDRLRVGQRVIFLSASEGLVRGTLTRLNRKSVTLLGDDGMQWRVSPSLLMPADDDIVDLEVIQRPALPAPSARGLPIDDTPALFDGPPDPPA
ncbi:MAG: hypothetical protein KF817_04610 [Phycisphaeraceae bacterium]|nr:hypothetical protein [Phycisphaeraceae bacterium]